MLYNVLRQFWQAKFAAGCLILSSSQFLLLPLNVSKNGARFKNGQNQLKNNNLATITACFISVCPTQGTKDLIHSFTKLLP
jgi:hypothetical protein